MITFITMGLFTYSQEEFDQALKKHKLLLQAEFDQQAYNIESTNRRLIEEIEHKHKLEIERIRNQSDMLLKERDFDLKHFKDKEVQDARTKQQAAEKALDIAKKEIEMLQKITNLNADIIDIKDLVTKIIGKLPEINLTSLTVQGGSNASK